MKLKGINKFREKIPYFKGKKTVMLPIFFISVFIACSLFLFSFYLIPEFFPANEIIYYLKPFFPVIGDFITGCIGLLLVYQLWARRDKLKKKYGQLSYQKIFLVGFGGIIIMFCIVFQALFPFYYWIPSYWTDLPSIIFTLSFSSAFFPELLIHQFILRYISR